MTLSESDLPVRDCKACGQADTDPRCHVGSWSPVPVASLPIFHMQCHARRGCPLCIERLTGAEGLTGADLRAHLAANPLTDERVAELLGQPAPDPLAPLRRKAARAVASLSQLPADVRAEALAHLMNITKENPDG